MLGTNLEVNCCYQRFHLSYERGCQGKNSLPSPRGGQVRGDLHPALSPFSRSFPRSRFGSPCSSAAMPAPVDGPDLMVSCNGSARRQSVTMLTQAKRWLKCQPSSCVRLEAYGFFWLSEGA